MAGPIVVPISGLSTHRQVASKVHRRTGLARPVYKRRTCSDNRAYSTVPFTIPGDVEAINYGPMWRADRDYWVARLTANVGLHIEGSHPTDGTPGGHDLVCNMRRVDAADNSNDQAILVSDGRLRIPENRHRDAVNDEDDGAFSVDDFNIHRLAEGDHIYPAISAVGTTRPGTGLVVSIVLVPIP